MLRDEFMTKLYDEMLQNYEAIYRVIKGYRNNKLQASDIRRYCGEDNILYNVLPDNISDIPILNHEHVSSIFQYYLSTMKLYNQIKSYEKLNISDEELETTFWTAHDFNRDTIRDCFPEGKEFLESKPIPNDLVRYFSD